MLGTNNLQDVTIREFQEQKIVMQRELHDAIAAIVKKYNAKLGVTPYSIEVNMKNIQGIGVQYNNNCIVENVSVYFDL